MMVNSSRYTSPRGKIIIYIIVGVLSIIFLLNIVKPVSTLPAFVTPATEASQALNITNAINNATLGFEKVMVVGLPERSDKRDVLALMAAVTGFKLAWVDGVLGSSISEKAVPSGWDREKMLDSNLGSWRGHINTIRRVVEEDLSSALILEDDADWDTHLKQQLVDFAQAARTLQHQSQERKLRGENEGEGEGGPHQHQQQQNPRQLDVPGDSPYGRHWDLLWLGAYISRFSEGRREPQVLIRDDATVASRRHLSQNGSFGWDEYPERARIVYVPAGDTICTFAYALSRPGARKALQYLGVEDQPTYFDFHMSDLCREKHLGVRCVAVVPGLFMHHRPRGRVLADSDILEKSGGDRDRVREVGFTENILYSTRLNLRNLVQGLEPAKQWEDD